MRPNAKYHLRQIIFINGNTMDCRRNNLRPARKGERVDYTGQAMAVNELGETMQSLIVRHMYQDRHASPAAWKAYCERCGD